VKYDFYMDPMTILILNCDSESHVSLKSDQCIRNVKWYNTTIFYLHLSAAVLFCCGSIWASYLPVSVKIEFLVGMLPHVWVHTVCMPYIRESDCLIPQVLYCTALVSCSQTYRRSFFVSLCLDQQ